jgi:hypothetical protein
MSWTKQQLSDMKELQLQKDILIPLFQAMKYKDVHIHQGPSEIGKDIVMWKETDVSPRVDYAVVVKADKITGKVAGNSGVSVILTQIQQCVGKNYLDHITVEPRQIRQVYVVSSKEITKDAIEHIEGALSASRLNLLVEFIDGEKLWELIEKHMSERTVLYRLAQIKQICDEADPYYRIVPVMNGDTISLTIQPKDPNALKDHPLKFSPYFTFHKSPEGRAKQEEVEQSLKSGSQVTITKEYIENLGLPEFFSRFIDPSTMSDWRITIGSLPPIMLTKIEMVCSDGERAEFDYIPLQRFDEEDGKTIYKNENQLVPWRIEVGLDKQTNPTHFNYHLKYEGVNINWALQGTLFERAMAKGGVLHIKSLETDLPLIGFNVQPKLFESPSAGWIELLEKLVFIQQKTRTLFSAPLGSIDIEQAQGIYNVAYILENGRINFVPVPYLLKVTGKEGSQRLLQYANQEHFAFGIGREEVVTVLDKEIHLGRAIYKMGKVTLSKEDWEALKLFNETGTPEGGIEVTIMPLEDSETGLEFQNWLLPNAETSIHPQEQEEVQNK